MTPVILDDALRARLNGLNEPVPVCETTGETVGHFVPEDQYRKLLYRLAIDAVSESELDAAVREPLGRKLSDVRRDLMAGE